MNTKFKIFGWLIAIIVVATGFSTVFAAGEPTLNSIVWNDVDGSGTYNTGDTIAFTFSEAMATATVRLAQLDSDLGLSAHTFGTAAAGLAITWNGPTNTILTVTLGTDATVAAADTCDPAATVTDAGGAGDLTLAPVAIPATDTIAPILNSVAWNDINSSTKIDAADTLVLTFSEKIAPASVRTDSVANLNTDIGLSGAHTVGGAAVVASWDATGKILTITLGAGTTVASGDTLNPAATVTDVATNADASSAKTITDNVGPKILTVTWSDVNSNTTIDGTDTLVITFSEPIATATVRTDTKAHLDADLGLSGSHTFDSVTVGWTVSDTVLTVTLGANTTVVSGDTINPAATVTDVPTNADASSAKTITDNLAPTLAQVSTIGVSNTLTPAYTFSTTEAGTITYSGSCASTTTAATVGNNTVIFNALSPAKYSNCRITVTDAYTNVSTALSVSSFEISFGGGGSSSGSTTTTTTTPTTTTTTTPTPTTTTTTQQTQTTTVTTTTTPTTTTQLGPITISKPLNQMTKDELVNTLLKLILTLIVQGKLTHL